MVGVEGSGIGGAGMRPETITISTSNIDVAASVQTVTGIIPEIVYSDAAVIASFMFPATPVVREALVGYETGLNLEAKRLLGVRNQLFRRLKVAR